MILHDRDITVDPCYATSFPGSSLYLENIERIELQYQMCQCLRCEFCRPTTEVYKFHSLLGSVGELSGDKLYLPAPLFNDISGIC